MAAIKETKDRLESWLKDEKIYVDSIPSDNNIDFGIRVAFPPGIPNPVPIAILKNKNQSTLQFQARLKIEEKDREELLKKDPMTLRKFSFKLKKELVRQNFLYAVNNKDGTYVINEILYDTQITKDQLMFTIRRVFNMFALMMIVFSEVVSGPYDPE